MRNGRRILLAILKLYVQIKIRLETYDANHPITDSMRTVAASIQKLPNSKDVRSADPAVSGETISLSISWRLAVDILHVMYIKDNQLLVINFIFEATGWTVQGSNFGGDEIFRTRPDRAWDSTQPPIQWVLGLFPGGKVARAWR
jgi:hypothetical protein